MKQKAQQKAAKQQVGSTASKDALSSGNDLPHTCEFYGKSSPFFIKHQSYIIHT